MRESASKSNVAYILARQGPSRSRAHMAFFTARSAQIVRGAADVGFASSTVRQNFAKKIRVQRYMEILMLDARYAKNVMQRKRYRKNYDETPPLKLTVKIGFSARA